MSRAHTFNGRTYTVLAHFEGDDSDAQAREYLRTHLHVKMLFSVPGEAMVISDRDFGQPVDAPDSEFGTKGWKSLYDQDEKDRRESKSAGFRRLTSGEVALSKTELLVAAGEMTAFALNLGRLSAYFAEMLLQDDEAEAERKAFFSAEAKKQRADFGADVHVPARLALASAWEAAGTVTRQADENLPEWLRGVGKPAIMELMLFSMAALEGYYLVQARDCGADPQSRRPRSPSKGAESDAAIVERALVLRGKLMAGLTWEKAVAEAAKQLGKRSPTESEVCRLAAAARQRARKSRRKTGVV